MSNPINVCVVDDEAANLESLERILTSDKVHVHTFIDPHQALQCVRKKAVDVVITDLRMGSMTGVDLLEAVKLIDPSIEVVVVTAYGTVELAVQAMKKGAYDFITKPLQRIAVLKVVERAIEKRRLVLENLSLREELGSDLEQHGGEVAGKSQTIKQMLEIAEQAASSKATVLIEGESGTGKGLLAEYIHRVSNKINAKNGIFVKINCAAIPDNLLEAELFGYEPGAFTGATRRKKGRIELAQGGTLFFDEIGIAPQTLQSKLLRFLQDSEFERLGGIETLRVDTRVISATNLDLKESIRQGRLREDLFYRLNVIQIRVPPLRERLEDIGLLAMRFLEDSAKKNARPVPLILPEAMDCLTTYDWPGNVRELQNLIERVVVLNRTGTVCREDLPPEFGGTRRQKNIVVTVGTPLKEVEKLIMNETLRTTHGDKRLAATLLGIHPRTIYRYLSEGRAEGREKPYDRTAEKTDESACDKAGERA